MQVEIDIPSFNDAVSWVTSNYNVRDTKAFITLHINSEGYGSLSYQEAHLYFKKDFNISKVNFLNEDVNDVKFALDGSQLRNIAQVLSKDKSTLKININLKDNNTKLTITAKGKRLNLNLLEYVNYTQPVIEEIGSIDTNVYFNNILKMSKIADNGESEAGSFLGAVELAFDTDNNKLRMFATDKYNLAVLKMDFKTEANINNETVLKSKILLPVRSASAIKTTLTNGANSDRTIFIVEKKKQNYKFGYKLSDGAIALFSLLKTEPMNDARIPLMKAENLSYHCIVNNDDFLQSVKSFAYVNNYSNFYFKINNDSLEITDEFQSDSIEVPNTIIDYDEDNPYITLFLYNRLISAFLPLTTKRTRISWSDDARFLVLNSIHDDDSMDDNVFVILITKKL